jgi:hypothetical protein
MSDVDWIFIVVTGLYLIESMVWLRPGVLVFTRFLGKFRAPMAAVRLIGNDLGAVILGGPLPWDFSFLCEPLPVSVSPQGVVPFVPAAPLQADRRGATGLMFSWDDLQEIRCEEQSLFVKSQFVCRTRNNRSAKHLCDTLKYIAALAGDDREPLILSLISDPLDQDRVAEQFQGWRERTGRLRLAASVLFFWTIPFGIILYYDIIPLHVVRDTQLAIAYFTIFGAIWLWSIVESFLSHRMLLPYDLAGRYKLLFTSMVSPAVPMRAPDRLARELFMFVHPLAFAHVLGDEAILRKCAEETVRDIEYPRLPDLPMGISSEARNVVQWSTAATSEHVRSLVSKMGLDYEGLVSQPTDYATESQSYCPRCHDDFVPIAATCSRCGNRPTKPLARN